MSCGDEPLDAITTFVKWKGDIIAFFRETEIEGRP